MSGLAAGEVVLDAASRTFRVRQDRSRTLKELVVRRGRGLGPATVEALKEVSLRIAPGEAVGLVGRNGAGKSSTLACLAGIVPLDSGRAGCGGRVVTLLELGAGFGPDFSGRENIYLNGALHGFGEEEIEARIGHIIEFSELGEFIDLPVKVYSSGMFLRLGFSIAAHLDADVMLIDEILAVGDESFQRKCFARISERMRAGATMVLVSHDPGAIERVCRRVVVLDGGRVSFDGAVTDGLLHYHELLGTDSGGSRSVRPGGAPALEVTELELHDGDGRLRTTFRPGDAMAVRMRLRATPGAERAVAALEVRSERGEMCFRTEAVLGAVEGEVDVSFEVPALALLEGSYDVAVAAGAQDAPPRDHLDRLTGLTVTAAEGGEGIADLRGRWTVAGRRAQEEALR